MNLEFSNNRIERILAIILLNDMKSASQKEKAKALNLAGFTNYEIAELLDVAPNVVANYVYQAKKKSNKKKVKNS